MGKRRGKREGQHWYRVHKARAGEQAVLHSSAVSAASAVVRELEARAGSTRAGCDRRLFSSIRILLFGKNEQERELERIETALLEARRNLSDATNAARTRGELAYGADWAARNPDRAKY